MMKRIAVVLAVLAMTAVVPVPSFGQPDAMPAGSRDGAGMHHMMQHPEMRSQMMRSPQHLLMMAYHKNVINFARVLDKAACQGDTVPPDVARTAVAEMRRSVDQIEKQRAGQKSPPEMQKMMDQHLITVKTHLRDLEDLSKSDRIPSQEVLKHTQFLLRGCDASQCDLRPGEGRGMHGKRMHMDGGCGCMQMMPQHREMMEQMKQKVKAQDQELNALVEKMKLAPRDKKVDLLADIVARMVQQRREFVNQMEKMQQEHLMHHQHMMQHGGATMPPPPCMTQGDARQGYDEDTDSNDDSNMEMENMNMQDEDD
jgi:hypothetical protein